MAHPSVMYLRIPRREAGGYRKKAFIVADLDLLKIN